MAKDSCLEDLKKDYEIFRKKYDLPGFDEMNQDFNIEKIAESDTDYLVREVRRFVADKIANYLRFVESLLHPVNSPMFVFSLIKSLGTEDMEKLKEIYKDLAKIEVDLVEIDVEYNEEKEIKFIKDSNKKWQEVKKDLLKIIDVIKKNWDSKFEVNNKGYFG